MESIYKDEKYDIKRIERNDLRNFSKYDFLEQIQIDDELYEIVKENEYYDFIDFNIVEYIENEFGLDYKYIDVNYVLYEQIKFGYVSVYLINNKFLFLKLL